MIMLKLAWRNIWRQRLRSVVILASIAVGIWAGIMMTGLATGMVESYLSDAILDIFSHFQIHHPKFKNEFDLEYRIKNSNEIVEQIRAYPEVKTVSPRSEVMGMASTSRSSRGVKIVGIIPDSESKLTSVHSKIKEGVYLEASSRNKIMVSRRLADKMELKLRAKIVLTFQNKEGDISASAHRISGIFQTTNQAFDENHVFVLKSELDQMIQSGVNDGDPFTNELALLLHDTEDLEIVQERLQNNFPELLIQSYRQLSPDLNLYESQIENISLIYLVIIMLALIFGIINTMLMAVLERIRELGMLMSIGMTKKRIFGLIVSESVLLALIAAPIGLILGYFTVQILSVHGLHLDQFSEGARRFGMASVIYPRVPYAAYINTILAVVITSILASLYPALKAMRLNPVEAIRQI